MNAVKYIRTKIFGLTQAPFAEVAGVKQPTVSRWESGQFAGSEPTLKEMERIRSAAIERGLAWNDELFFQTFADEEKNEGDNT